MAVEMNPREKLFLNDEVRAPNFCLILLAELSSKSFVKRLIECIKSKTPPIRRETFNYITTKLYFLGTFFRMRLFMFIGRKVMINLIYIFKFLECGKFCINYVLKKEKIKRRVKYNGVMMSLGLIKRVMKEYFDKVGCYELDKNKLPNKSRFITLLKYGHNYMHYVVVEKIENDLVYYYDPLFITLRKKKKEKFIKKWSGYCCFFSKKSNC